MMLVIIYCALIIFSALILLLAEDSYLSAGQKRSAQYLPNPAQAPEPVPAPATAPVTAPVTALAPAPALGLDLGLFPSNELEQVRRYWNLTTPTFNETDFFGLVYKFCYSGPYRPGKCFQHIYDTHAFKVDGAIWKRPSFRGSDKSDAVTDPEKFRVPHAAGGGLGYRIVFDYARADPDCSYQILGVSGQALVHGGADDVSSSSGAKAGSTATAPSQRVLYQSTVVNDYSKRRSTVVGGGGGSSSVSGDYRNNTDSATREVPVLIWTASGPAWHYQSQSSSSSSSSVSATMSSTSISSSSSSVVQGKSSSPIKTGVASLSSLGMLRFLIRSQCRGGPIGTTDFSG
jgi:hypothetical protein